MLKVKGNQKIVKSDIRRIMVRATNWVGDVVMSLPALEAVRKNFPTSSITVLAKPWVIPLFENHPSVDQILVYRKDKGRLKDIGEMIRVLRVIRKNGFDLAILFQNAFEAALLAYLGGVGFRLGYNTDGRGFLLTHRVITTDDVLKVHQIEYYMSIMEAMGWDSASLNPRLYVGKRNLKKGKVLLEANGIKTEDFLLGVGPGAVFGEAKRWPAERFARVADWAVEKWGAKVLVMGSQDESTICDILSTTMKHRPLNLCGLTSLGEAMALINWCDFFVSNDSGLMHISAAMGVPTVAIFGSTDPVTTGPRGPKTSIVRNDIECAPCLKPECPKDHRCMLSIEPEDVWEEMEQLRSTIHREIPHENA